MADQFPAISVIIPTLNEERHLPTLLGALAQQTFTNFEVIIADCESIDQTLAVVDSYKGSIDSIHATICKQKSVGTARNLGAAMAKGDFFVFFDADVEPSLDFLEKIYAYKNKYRLDCMTVWNRTKSSAFAGRAMLWLLNHLLSGLQHVKPFANGPCMIMTRKLFQGVGGFDEAIVFGEDFDFMWRAHKHIMRFKVFSTPKLYVSTRRFDKEGFVRSFYKSARAVIHALLVGPIRKPIFSYEMGGQYYK